MCLIKRSTITKRVGDPDGQTEPEAFWIYLGLKMTECLILKIREIEEDYKKKQIIHSLFSFMFSVVLNSPLIRRHMFVVRRREFLCKNTLS